jgi:hypothetical protein
MNISNVIESYVTSWFEMNDEGSNRGGTQNEVITN